MDDPQLTPDEALNELQLILNIAAREGSPQRLAASRYTVCRDALMKAGLKPALPGFLVQCLTYDRFHDFIHLYDPTVEARKALVDESLRGCASRIRARPTHDVFNDFDF